MITKCHAANPSSAGWLMTERYKMDFKELFSETVLKVIFIPYLCLGCITGFVFTLLSQSKMVEIIIFAAVLGIFHIFAAAISVLVIKYIDKNKSTIGINKGMIISGFILSYITGLTLGLLINEIH